MVESENEEQRVLEQKLRKALDEALTKTRTVLDETGKTSGEIGKKLLLAAEAVEYTCLLYSLTYGLEDVDPPVQEAKGRDTKSLVKECVTTLTLIRGRDSAKPEETYGRLRNAAHGLRTAYLSSLKKAGRSS